MPDYKVIYERDAEGWWVARIPRVPGCHTQGKTIKQARQRIREALGLYVSDMKRVRLIDDIRLPTNAKSLLNDVLKRRERAEREREQLQQSTSAAAKALTKHLSVRDAGELLGLSHQRVQQIVGKSPKTKNRKLG